LGEELAQADKSDILETVVEQLLAKIQRQRWRFTPQTQEELAVVAGMPLTSKFLVSVISDYLNLHISYLLYTWFNLV
jgi:hypothetical protein